MNWLFLISRYYASIHVTRNHALAKISPTAVPDCPNALDCPLALPLPR